MGRYCKTCGVTHEKPTGRGCRRLEMQTPVVNNDAECQNAAEGTSMLSLLQDISGRMQGMERRMEVLESGQTAGIAQPQVDDTAKGTHQVSTTEHATPETLRSDSAAMAEVAAKLAEWGIHDDDLDKSMAPEQIWCMRWRKSGTVTKGTDSIKCSIDWPHFHIRKGPKREPPEFKHLTSEEFVLGYLRMLRSPDSKFDQQRMLEILQDVMEDTVDFGWERARSFYDILGLEVEKKRLDWSDRQEILKFRLIHARSPAPTDTSRSPRVSTNTRIKPCAAFQSSTCDHTTDHGQFRHVCDYCYRARNMTFPHAEADCKTKRINQAKNV